MTGRGKISLRQLRPLLPVAFGDAPPEADAVGARRRTEYPRKLHAFDPRERIVVSALLEPGDGADGGGEERNLARKDVAEQTRDAQRHIDPRPAQHRDRQNLKSADAARRGVPGRAAADQRESLREIVTA